METKREPEIKDEPMEVKEEPEDSFTSQVDDNPYEESSLKMDLDEDSEDDIPLVS